MILQSQVNRRYRDTEYKKFWVVIPLKLIKKLGWKKGQELEAEIKKGKLIIEND